MCSDILWYGCVSAVNRSAWTQKVQEKLLASWHTVEEKNWSEEKNWCGGALRVQEIGLPQKFYFGLGSTPKTSCPLSEFKWYPSECQMPFSVGRVLGLVIQPPPWLIHLKQGMRIQYMYSYMHGLYLYRDAIYKKIQDSYQICHINNDNEQRFIYKNTGNICNK